MYKYFQYSEFVIFLNNKVFFATLFELYSKDCLYTVKDQQTTSISFSCISFTKQVIGPQVNHIFLQYINKPPIIGIL